MLTELIVLEIRGTNDRKLEILLDKPMPLLRYVNFETINLMGSGNSHPNPDSIQSFEFFEYVPESEKNYGYNLTLEVEEEEIKIVPYDVYILEKTKLKMASFYGWTNLIVLRMHNCHLEDLHWEMFDGLTSLKHLSLEHNEIQIIPPFAFYGALHLQTLSLARNSIMDLNYRSLAGLLELEKLDLSFNNLTKLSELSFPPFPKLNIVDIRDNPIKMIFPMTFAVMNNTEHLYIGSKNCELDMSMGNSFTSLGQLKTLTITNATAPVIYQNIFKGLKKLEKLKMHGNFSRIEFDAFAESPMLKELILSGCGIQEISMDIFYGMRNLEIIDLSQNQLVYMPHGVFDDQKKITEIYLQGNKLTELPINFFEKTPTAQLIR